MVDANHFIVTIRRAVDRTDIDPTITMAALLWGALRRSGLPQSEADCRAKRRVNAGSIPAC